MLIFDHFKNINLTNDQHNVVEKLRAFLENHTQIFLLKGYAGTGKTTILKGLVQYLNKIKRQFELV